MLEILHCFRREGFNIFHRIPVFDKTEMYALGISRSFLHHIAYSYNERYVMLIFKR